MGAARAAFDETGAAMAGPVANAPNAIAAAKMRLRIVISSFVKLDDAPRRHNAM